MTPIIASGPGWMELRGWAIQRFPPRAAVPALRVSPFSTTQMGSMDPRGFRFSHAGRGLRDRRRFVHAEGVPHRSPGSRYVRAPWVSRTAPIANPEGVAQRRAGKNGRNMAGRKTSSQPRSSGPSFCGPSSCRLRSPCPPSSCLPVFFPAAGPRGRYPAGTAGTHWAQGAAAGSRLPPALGRRGTRLRAAAWTATPVDWCCFANTLAPARAAALPDSPAKDALDWSACRRYYYRVGGWTGSAGPAAKN